MPKGFFITGTDTGVGKTIIAGALIKTLGFMGLRTGGMKPIESGCGREGTSLVPFDGMFLKETAHMDEPLSIITPCCFETPLAPLPASELEIKKVSIPAIRSAFQRLSKSYDALVIEGIGGVLAPIRKNYAVIDLAMEFGLPLIVVAKPGLGTINHTMLTIYYALGRGLPVAGVIINYSMPPEHSISEKTNPRVLSQVCPVPVIGTFPYMSQVTEDGMEKAARKHFDLEVLRKYL